MSRHIALHIILARIGGVDTRRAPSRPGGRGLARRRGREPRGPAGHARYGAAPRRPRRLRGPLAPAQRGRPGPPQLPGEPVAVVPRPPARGRARLSGPDRREFRPDPYARHAARRPPGRPEERDRAGGPARAGIHRPVRRRRPRVPSGASSTSFRRASRRPFRGSPWASNSSIRPAKRWPLPRRTRARRWPS